MEPTTVSLASQPWSPRSVGWWDLRKEVLGVIVSCRCGTEGHGVLIVKSDVVDPARGGLGLFAWDLLGVVTWVVDAEVGRGVSFQGVRMYESLECSREDFPRFFDALSDRHGKSTGYWFDASTSPFLEVRPRFPALGVE